MKLWIVFLLILEKLKGRGRWVCHSEALVRWVLYIGAHHNFALPPGRVNVSKKESRAAVLKHCLTADGCILPEYALCCSAVEQQSILSGVDKSLIYAGFNIKRPQIWEPAPRSLLAAFWTETAEEDLSGKK